jgi:internalin A
MLRQHPASRTLFAMALVWMAACRSTSTGPDVDTLGVTTTTLPSIQSGQAYSQMLAATGGDGAYTWVISAGSLPVGIMLTSSSGALQGTPTTPGLATFTVGVTSGDGQSATRELTIDVTAPPLPALMPGESCTGEPATREATFADANLDAEVRAALGLGVNDDLRCGGLAGLSSLVADSSAIADLTGIQNLTGLVTLGLTGNTFSDLTLLGGLASLSTLDLSWNAIVDVGALATLTSLTEVVLDNNAITDLDALATLTGLTRLSADNNVYSSIAAVAGMTGLTDLDVSDSNVADLGPLTGLTALELLDLDRNMFTSITSLGTLTGLVRVDLDGNTIADLSPLAGATALEWLEANGVGNADISSFVPLTALMHLELAGNSLVDVSVVEFFVQLAFLDLSSNPGLADIQALVDNAGLAAGDTINLTGTPSDCVDVMALEARGATVSSDCGAPVLVPQITNGPDMAGRSSYWTAPILTIGPALTLQIFDDGTGQIAYDNDSFQPPTPLSTRTLYPLTWTESGGAIDIVFGGASASFGAVRSIVGSTSFIADYDDGVNQATYTFTFFVGVDPPR